MNAVGPTLLLLGAMATSAGAHSSTLEGRYEGNGENAELQVYVEGGNGIAVLRGSGCVGELQGIVLENMEGIWGLLQQDEHASCMLLMTPDGPLSCFVSQGPGCTDYHGASCSFSGYMRKLGR